MPKPVPKSNVTKRSRESDDSEDLTAEDVALLKRVLQKIERRDNKRAKEEVKEEEVKKVKDIKKVNKPVNLTTKRKQKALAVIDLTDD